VGVQVTHKNIAGEKEMKEVNIYLWLFFWACVGYVIADIVSLVLK